MNIYTYILQRLLKKKAMNLKEIEKNKGRWEGIDGRKGREGDVILF